MNRIFWITLASVCGLSAQTVVTPLAGTFVNSGGRIELVHGVLGNLLPPDYLTAPAELQGQAILSAAFGANGAAIKTEFQLILLDGQSSIVSVQAAPAGPALFSFSAAGSPAWVYYAVGSELVNIESGGSTENAGAVVALGIGGATSVPSLTSSGGQLWSAGARIPGSAPGAFFQGGWLTGSNNELLWTPATGGAAGLQIPLSETVRSIQIAGAGTVVINGEWLLNARFQLLEIPRMTNRAPVRIRP